MNNKIKLILDESGQIKKASKSFNLYQNSVATVGLELYVPRQMLNAPMVADDNTVIGSNSVTIYAVATSETGKRITSPAEQCVFSHKEEFDGIEYWIFTRATGLPKEFLRYAGDLTICASICRIYTADDGSTKLEGRSKMQMFTTQVLPSPDSNLDPDFEASELTALYDLLNSTIIENEAIYGDKGKTGTIHANPAVNLSTLEDAKSNRTETVLKFDLKDKLPKHITYNKNGYKTVGVYFMNETFTVPTDVVPVLNLETVTGSLLVINIAPDVEHPGTIAWQNELFHHERGIASRKIKLDISLYKETGAISVLDIGEWKIQNYAWYDATAKQFVKVENCIKNLQDDYVSKLLNEAPLNEKEEFTVSETGALQQTTTHRDIRTGEKTTTTATPIPVKEGQPRLFLPQEKQTLDELRAWMESLSGEALNYIVDLRDIPLDPTESETVQNFLMEKYKTVTATPDTIFDQATLHDENLGVVYRWYKNLNQWVLSQGSLTGKATNNMYDENGILTTQGNVGGVTGSNKEGYIFYEINGEGALNGYDALKQQTKNNAQAIADEIANRQLVMQTESETRANEDAAIKDIIGVLSTLTTSQKDTLVNAINSLKTDVNTNAANILAQSETLQNNKADRDNPEQSIQANQVNLQNDGSLSVYNKNGVLKLLMKITNDLYPRIYGYGKFGIISDSILYLDGSIVQFDNGLLNIGHGGASINANDPASNNLTVTADKVAFTNNIEVTGSINLV